MSVCSDPASGGEAVAALATTAGQDGAAGAGAHAQPEAVGLVPAPVVRLERALAQRIHSTRGAGYGSPVTGVGSCEPRRQSWVNWHRSPMERPVRSGCHGHAAPVDAGADLPTVRGARGQGQFDGKRAPGRPNRVSCRDTPQPGDNWACPCGQLVDPQGRELLASLLPTSSTACVWPTDTGHLQLLLLSPRTGSTNPQVRGSVGGSGAGDLGE
jgi:hypothetical protein